MKDKNLIWIEPVRRTVTWTERATVAVGRHSCNWCQVMTPDPTDSDIIEFVKNPQLDHRTLWPFGTRNMGPGRFEPPGWGEREDLQLCPDCLGAYDSGVAAARSHRTKAREP